MINDVNDEWVAEVLRRAQAAAEKAAKHLKERVKPDAVVPVKAAPAASR